MHIDFAQNGSTQEAYAFGITVLEAFRRNTSIPELKAALCDSYTDEKIDAITFGVSKTGVKEVRVFDISRKDSFKLDDCNMFFTSVQRYLLSGSPLSNLDIRQRQLFSKVRRKLGAGWRLNLCITRHTPHNASLQLNRIAQTLKQRYDSIGEIVFLNQSELINTILGVRSEKPTSFSWPIHVEGDGQSNSAIVLGPREARRVLVGLLSWDSIIRLNKKYADDNFSLFADNLRGYQGKGSVKLEIIRSLMNGANDFFIHHNGLTFSCSKIIVNRDQKYTIHDPQIINGCQSVNVITQALQSGSVTPSKVRQASVWCRFYVLDQARSKTVCESTNNQTPIHPIDLRSNDPIQKIIEQGIVSAGLVYRRKRTRVRAGIGMDQLGQWIYSCVWGSPANAKNEKQSLFELSGKYDDVFSERRLTLNTILRLNAIAQFVRSQFGPLRRRAPYIRDADLHVMAGMYIVLKNEANLSHQIITKSFRRVFKVLGRVISHMRRLRGRARDREYSFNKMFTKDLETWRVMQIQLGYPNLHYPIWMD